MMTKKHGAPKRVLMFLLAALLLLPFAAFGATRVHANDITVTIDGRRVDFDGQGPVVVDGRTLVPVRGVFEALGFDVGWEAETETAVISNADYVIRIPIGRDVFTTNGRSHRLDVVAQTIGGRTMVPIRLPLESVGFGLGWDDATQTVVISSPVVVVVEEQEQEDDAVYLDVPEDGVTGEDEGDDVNEDEVEDDGENLDVTEDMEAVDTGEVFVTRDGIRVGTEEELWRAIGIESVGDDGIGLVRGFDGAPVVVYLTADIELTFTLFIIEADVTIRSVGNAMHTLTATGNFDAIEVYRALVLENVEVTRRPSTQGVGIWNNGLLILNSGSINGHNSLYGGGVVNLGEFIMNGGIISQNNATWGAGVSTFGAFTMEDGEITDNTARFRGGGVNVGDEGVFILNGGLISNNRANHGTGVHVYGVQTYATFHMNGGTIRNDTVSIYGYGSKEITGGEIN